MAFTSKGVTETETRLLGEGVTQEFLESERSKGKGGTAKGINFDPQDFQSTLDAYNLIRPTVTSDVAVGDTAAPTGGLQGIYDTIAGEEGLDDLQSAVGVAKGDLTEAQQRGRAQQQALRDRPESINLIRGRQQQAGLLQHQEELALAEAANLSIDEYNAAKESALFKYGIAATEYQTIQNVMLNNPGAGIRIGDDMTTVTGKLATRQEALKQQQIDRENFIYDRGQKDQLKALASSLGINPKGKSTKDLYKKIAKTNKGALEQQDQLFNLQLQQQQAALTKAQNAIKDTTPYNYNEGNPFKFYGVDNVSASEQVTPQEATQANVYSFYPNLK